MLYHFIEFRIDVVDVEEVCPPKFFAVLFNCPHPKRTVTKQRENIRHE